MQHECKITVLETKCFSDLQEQYLADPKSGPCPFFKPGDTFLLTRTPQQDDFYHLMNGKFCGEAWDAVSRYVYTVLQGGSIMKGWTNDDRMMIACCNDGTRPVIFKIERIDSRRMVKSGSGWKNRASRIRQKTPILVKLQIVILVIGLTQLSFCRDKHLSPSWVSLVRVCEAHMFASQ